MRNKIWGEGKDFFMNQQIVKDMNVLGAFCGKRDIQKLSTIELNQKYGIKQVDVMVLFGGSILCGGDLLAEAIQNKIAKQYVIVGGFGHTTETLRQKVQAIYPTIHTDGCSEAEIFQQYIHTRYGLTVDHLECRSTNCGNNITYLLELLKEKQIDFENILLCQDATMQRRMEAGMRKYVSDSIQVLSYATYQVKVIEQENQWNYDNQPYGMWEMERYVTLLMGEISRLSDNEEGYGPKGKNFIAHVEIPKDVMEAFERLKKVYGEKIREANPLYAG